ncbi:MAG: hypothetical protein NZ789_15040 [Pseudomonadales bacterium]|nr:hypothetical protein [Pseudomonadales bacterium]
MRLTRSGYLKAMGIDVWTSRSAVAPQVVATVDAAIEPANSPTGMSRQAAAKKVETDAAVQIGDAATGKQIPEFMLALFHYETIGICLSLRAESELPRRFCDDVARAMGGNIESVRYQLLKWPMLSTSGIDQSINAAREVVTQKFRQMPARVLVFGDDVGEYYYPLRDLAPLSVGAVGVQTFLKAPSLKGLLGSGSAKRELMLAMHRWRSSEMP